MTVPIRGLVVCVDYDDLLEITLWRNARHLTEVLVVTRPGDDQTKDVVASVPCARFYETDAFYRHGAKFNKGLAIEEALDVLGRDGWIVIFDADTLFPDEMTLSAIEVGKLYSPVRVLLDDPRRWTPEFKWEQAKPTQDFVFAGYFQLFHADDPVLHEKPWYDVGYTHAGGGDWYFQQRWAEENKIRPAFKVLHLGPRDRNWFGRTSGRMDGEPLPDGIPDRNRLMTAFLTSKNWNGRGARPAEFPEKLEQINS